MERGVTRHKHGRVQPDQAAAGADRTYLVDIRVGRVIKRVGVPTECHLAVKDTIVPIPAVGVVQLRRGLLDPTESQGCFFVLTDSRAGGPKKRRDPPPWPASEVHEFDQRSHRSVA